MRSRSAANVLVVVTLLVAGGAGFSVYDAAPTVLQQIGGLLLAIAIIQGGRLLAQWFIWMAEHDEQARQYLDILSQLRGIERAVRETRREGDK